MGRELERHFGRRQPQAAAVNWRRSSDVGSSRAASPDLTAVADQEAIRTLASATCRRCGRQTQRPPAGSRKGIARAAAGTSDAVSRWTKIVTRWTFDSTGQVDSQARIN